MLEPREADIPVLFLFLVVLPLVTYFLLGKWNETSKKKARISMLAQLAAEEAFQVEAMATASVIPSVVRSPSKSGSHECARCLAPAITRCSRCKSVRYCSGNCQIIHWRQSHKLECWQRDDYHSDSASNSESVQQSVLLKENSRPVSDSLRQDAAFVTSSTDVDECLGTTKDRKHSEKWMSQKIFKEMAKTEDNPVISIEEANNGGPSIAFQSKEALVRHKLGKDSHFASSDVLIKQSTSSTPITARGPPYKVPDQNGGLSEISSGSCNSPYLDRNGTDSHELIPYYTAENGHFIKEENVSSTNERLPVRGSSKSRSPYNLGTSGSISHGLAKVSRAYPCSGGQRRSFLASESKTPTMSASTNNKVQETNDISKSMTKMVGPKKLPKFPRQDSITAISDGVNRYKMLFPYEEFVKFFQCEVWDLSPRGLLNCGNSCYANAVLQCLTSTKPLMIYLLRRSHSSACRERDWCLMCELEQHVAMMREGGGPLSPSPILSRMRNIGCRMGAGNQEDAHEFLRLLVASMQSICLEGLGSEKEIDPKLQESTFIQHTFGGRLRSKVMCLRCHHESERYENIMDLTLEILGWVESLEDALTQFTAPEDLDGENMYRCGRCAAYVKARKQLSIHEAPNILTIVLKRFQTGKYGKINKCITFPDMLDMIPFMTGNGDSPPLYMLYGVVVHLDTQNASFSGHYVSYVKDVQGIWFKIDDTQVEPVPMSQVMSEGAYILFYSRSYPRPQRVCCNGSIAPVQASASAKNATSKCHKSPRQGHSSKGGNISHSSQSPSFVGRRIPRPEMYSSAGGNYADPPGTDYSDATSSDWSLFTSSDESSFTTESTRDSFSTVDYSDTLNGDPVSSLFSTLGIPEYNNSTISCKMYSPCRPHTRFFSESKGFVLDSSVQGPRPGSFVHTGKNSEEVSVSLADPSLVLPASNCSRFVRYGRNPKATLVQTSGHCGL
ncbi:ubiquitin C-terminal hydrolase 15-like [Aristolochia californica]|uniref:ubiquitin C-terminal hydrolase 15-like n=1 Tax=Aristolochia californica TaxID=171875 RepID=UPI0035E3AFFE